MLLFILSPLISQAVVQILVKSGKKVVP